MQDLSNILAALRREFSKLLSGQLDALYLYGSQARGDSHSGSDIDVLVVINGEFDYADLLARTSEIVAALSFENDVVISRAFVSKARFEQERSPFLLNVRREAVPIWPQRFRPYYKRHIKVNRLSSLLEEMVSWISPPRAPTRRCSTLPRHFCCHADYPFPATPR